MARKRDAAVWPAQYSAVGVPSKLLNNIENAGDRVSVAYCLLISDSIEGSATGVVLHKQRNPS